MSQSNTQQQGQQSLESEELEEVETPQEDVGQTMIDDATIIEKIEKQEKILEKKEEDKKLQEARGNLGISCLDYLKLKGNNPQDSFIASGVKELDALLRNGLRTGIITEIYGPDQSCKTSIALQFALNAIFSEKSTEKVYSLFVSSAKRPHQLRMNQIVEGIRQRLGNSLPDDKITQLTDQFIEIQTPSVIQFKAFVQEELASHLTKLHKIRILVIDNIYDLATQIEDYRDRQAFLLRIINLLKQFAHQSNSAVLIINNVVAQISDNNSQTGFAPNITIPALGNLWTHLLNERIQLSLLGEIKQNQPVRASLSGEIKQNPPVRARRLAIRISPRLPLDSLQFIPDNFGISVIKH